MQNVKAFECFLGLGFTSDLKAASNVQHSEDFSLRILNSPTSMSRQPLETHRPTTWPSIDQNRPSTDRQICRPTADRHRSPSSKPASPDCPDISQGPDRGDEGSYLPNMVHMEAYGPIVVQFGSVPGPSYGRNHFGKWVSESCSFFWWSAKVFG